MTKSRDVASLERRVNRWDRRSNGLILLAILGTLFLIVNAVIPFVKLGTVGSIALFGGLVVVAMIAVSRERNSRVTLVETLDSDAAELVQDATEATKSGDFARSADQYAEALDKLSQADEVSSWLSDGFDETRDDIAHQRDELRKRADAVERASAGIDEFDPALERLQSAITAAREHTGGEALDAVESARTRLRKARTIAHDYGLTDFDEPSGRLAECEAAVNEVSQEVVQATIVERVTRVNETERSAHGKRGAGDLAGAIDALTHAESELEGVLSEIRSCSIPPEESLLDVIGGVVVEIEDLPKIGPTRGENLRTAGIETILDIQEASMEDLRAVDGIGDKTAREISEAAADVTLASATRSRLRSLREQRETLESERASTKSSDTEVDADTPSEVSETTPETSEGEPGESAEPDQLAAERATEADSEDSDEHQESTRSTATGREKESSADEVSESESVDAQSAEMPSVSNDDDEATPNVESEPAEDTEEKSDTDSDEQVDQLMNDLFAED